MAILTIVVQVDDEVDPTLTDPWGLAESILDTYAEDRSHATDTAEITFVNSWWND